jgi:IS605 OrfB family transposase
MATIARKPVVIENLDFRKHKAEGNSKHSRMISSFAYSQAQQILRSACYRSGIEVLSVNPAYTSTIGAINYAQRFGISVHMAAALVIARRGLGFSECPVRVGLIPARNGATSPSSYLQGIGQSTYGRSGHWCERNNSSACTVGCCKTRTFAAVREPESRDGSYPCIPGETPEREVFLEAVPVVPENLDKFLAEHVEHKQVETAIVAVQPDPPAQPNKTTETQPTNNESEKE